MLPSTTFQMCTHLSLSISRACLRLDVTKRRGAQRLQGTKDSARGDGTLRPIEAEMEFQGARNVPTRATSARMLAGMGQARQDPGCGGRVRQKQVRGET